MTHLFDETSKLTMDEAMKMATQLLVKINDSKTIGELRKALPISINYPTDIRRPKSPRQEMQDWLGGVRDRIFGPFRDKGKFTIEMERIVEAMEKRLREETARNPPSLW